MVTAAPQEQASVEALLKRIAYLETLLRTSEVLNSTLELDEVLQLVLDQACAVVDAEAGSLWLLEGDIDGEESRPVLRPRVARGGTSKALMRISLAPGEGLVGQTVAEGKPLLVADVLTDERWARRVGDKTGYVTRTLLCVPLSLHGRAIGALQLINKRGGLFDPDDLELCSALANQAAVVIENGRLFTEQRLLFLSTITTLSRTLDARDPYTHGHSMRVSEYSAYLATQMGWPPKDVEALRLAAILHDLGKIGVRDRILLKRARLSPRETELMQRHPAIGASIIAEIQPPRLMRLAVVAAHSHQERWDGKGYPDGVAGEAIPLSARIVAVADVFDALTTDRPYRRGLSLEVAREIMTGEAGKGLDPELVQVFWGAVDRLRSDPAVVDSAPEALRALVLREAQPVT